MNQMAVRSNEPAQLENHQQNAAQLASFSSELSRRRKLYENILPAGVSASQITQSIVSAISKNPKLMECTRESLLIAAVASARLGLIVDGITGQGYILSFKNNKTGNNEAQFIIGYKGYITLGQRCGIMISGGVVHAGDDFAFSFGTDSFLRHVPTMEDGVARDRLAFYAVARSNDLPSVFTVLSVADVNAKMKGSKGYRKYGSGEINRFSPWVTDYNAMGKKSAIRDLGAQLPLNIQQEIAQEDAAEQGARISVSVGPSQGALEAKTKEPGDERDAQEPAQNTRPAA